MSSDNKNIIDKFLEKYDEFSGQKKVEVKTYYRPTLLRCIIGFVFCLVIFLILVRLFNFSIVYLVVFFGDILLLLYFGVNLFTKRGLPIPIKQIVSEEYYNNHNEENEYEKEDESNEE